MQLELKKIEEIVEINIHATLPEQTNITASDGCREAICNYAPRSALSKSVWNLLSSLGKKKRI